MTRRLDVRIALALLVTTLLPLGISIYLVAQTVDTSLRVGLNDEIAQQLERSLTIHRRFIESVKHGHQVRFEHLLDSATLVEASTFNEESRVEAVLEELVEADSSLRLVRLSGPEGRTIEVEAVGDPTSEPQRTVSKKSAITAGPYTSLEAVFGVDASIISDFEKAGEDVTTYQALAQAPPAYLGQRFILAYVAVLGVGVAFAILLGILWARRLAGRIHRLSAATGQVAAGDLSVRVEPGSLDEVGVLVESFNGMVAELSMSRARIEYLQKISAWQEMARRLAHEIKNPLTPIHLAAQQLREKYNGDDEKFARLLDQSTEIIEEEVATLRRLTSDFSSFARLPQVKPELVDLGEFLEECNASLVHIGEQGDVTLLWDTPQQPVPAVIDRMMMKRVIDNLVRNAAEALAKGEVSAPQIRVSATKVGSPQRPEVEIRVEDNGPGIQPEHHPSIFDPYFTTKTEGTGLGLAISKKIVLEHGGRIWIDEQGSKGAAFVIVVPADSGTGEDA
ncbi:MAG: HAMP domain-containing protein [Deltaproteobacteria bacterium]|nr:HAMP domain-containing protein [Deltaproteobacteria bacterium]